MSVRLRLLGLIKMGLNSGDSGQATTEAMLVMAAFLCVALALSKVVKLVDSGKFTSLVNGAASHSFSNSYLEGLKDIVLY